MSSAKADAPIFCPLVEELRDGDTPFVNIAGKFCHVYDEFHFAFAVAEECADEVPQTFFCTLQLCRA